MSWNKEFAAARGRWALLKLYQRFVHASIVILSGLIATVVVAAISVAEQERS
jgi:hypothetical protein